MPDKELRKREHNRLQTGRREPRRVTHQTTEEFLLNKGKIKVYKPTCKAEHKRKPFIEIGLENL